MASTKELQLSLPRICPNTYTHYAEWGPEAKYAVYALTQLNQQQLQNLQTDLNSAEESTGGCKLAPQPDFSGRLLRDVYDYHIRIRDEDQSVHPLYFIVADQADWTNKGILAIDLACNFDGEEDRVGVGRCSVDMAESWGANLNIGNLDWMDLKEQEERDWGGEDPYADYPTAEQYGVEKLKFGWYSLAEKGECLLQLEISSKLQLTLSQLALSLIS